jgi:glycosyltransferase involved in cell wall biosynthesis
MIDLLKQKGLSYEILQVGSLKSIFGIFRYILGVIKLLIYLYNYNPDIILSNTVRSHVLASSISFFSNKKLVWILRDYQYNKNIKQILEFVPNKIICVSKDLKEFYKGGDKYHVIPNGIEVITKRNNKFINYRKKYNINNEELVLGLASTFSRWKGIEYLIKGFYETQNKKNNFKGKIMIAGQAKKGSKEYKYYIQLKKLVNKLDIKDKVIFVGWTDNIYDFFRSCDVVVSSSTTDFGGPESFGRTILEAWSVKRPVISTNVGGPKEIVSHKIDGIKVEQKNVESLANAILFMQDKDNRIKLGKNGYKKLLNKYNLERISRKYMTLIEKLI